MTRRALVLVLVWMVGACAADLPTTITSLPTTLPPTPSTTVVAATPATAAPEPRGCSTPPVAFALLCDVYEHLDENHVDAPLDPASLAAGFSLGVSGFEGTESAPPGPLLCAVPAPEFEPACELIAGAGGPTADAVEAGVAAMVTYSLDPFTYYIPPELSGSFTPDGVVAALGIILTVTDVAGSVCTVIAETCRLEVVTVFPDSPALDAGLRPGDQVVAIDGNPVGGRTLIDVAALLDGATGTTVELEVADSSPRTVLIERRQPVWPEMVVEMPRSGVGYLRIPDFSVGTPLAVHAALGTFAGEGVTTLVLDLRDNPGGLVDAVTLVASEFLDEGLVLRTLGRDGDFDYPVQPGGTAVSGMEVVVVVNGGSASASEVLAGVLQERNRAKIVGSPTFGKDSVQIGFPLRNDGVLRVTIAHWVTPAGQSVAPGGVEPDEPVDIPVDATAAQVVDAALGT